jgi:hypothetical protein
VSDFLMALCDEIESGLTESSGLSEKLAAAVVAQQTKVDKKTAK